MVPILYYCFRRLIYFRICFPIASAKVVAFFYSANILAIFFRFIFYFRHKYKKNNVLYAVIFLRNILALTTKKRKGEPLIWFTFCAQDETRTHTTLLPLPPQSSVYTNFTTCAYTFQEINFERKTRLELATPTLARLCSTN